MLTVGLLIILAALCGGGVHAFGLEVPILSSLKRQVAVGILGVILVALSVSGFLSTNPKPLHNSETNSSADATVIQGPSAPAPAVVTHPEQIRESPERADRILTTSGDCSPIVDNSSLGNLSTECKK
jgi:hypothetical protein